MRANFLLACLLLGATGCISANTTRVAPAESERIRDLEARVARLEAQPADLEDRILALQAERASLLAAYDASHPAVQAVDGKIRALDAAQAERHRARRETMARRLEVERETLLVTCTAEHPSVRKLDAQIAFLRSP